MYTLGLILAVVLVWFIILWHIVRTERALARPINPSVGQHWYDINTGFVYRYNGKLWVLTYERTISN